MTEDKPTKTKPTTFSFSDGRKVRFPTRLDDVPRLPPRAVKLVLDLYEAHGVDPSEGVGDLDDPRNMPFFMEMATTAVALTVKRLERSVTIDDMMDDADIDHVLGVFPTVVKRNPTLFGGKKGKTPGVKGSGNSNSTASE